MYMCTCTVYTNVMYTCSALGTQCHDVLSVIVLVQCIYIIMVVAGRKRTLFLLLHEV